MTIQFTDDEIETIKELICDWGSDCPCTDYEKIQELRYKLGLEKRPTEEELVEEERKRKEFVESPLGKQMANILKSNNYLIEEINKDFKLDILYFSGPQWPVGYNLKIKLPNDYKAKE